MSARWSRCTLALFFLTSIAACGSTSSPPPPEPSADAGSTDDAKITCTPGEECAPSDVPCMRYICMPDGACILGDMDEDGTACDSDPCLSGQTCATGVCEGGTPAPADCQGAVCGDDACGNSCGACAEGEECVDGACETPVSACGDIVFEGCCMPGGTVLKYCEDGALQEADCGAEGGVCTWGGAKEFYLCGLEPAVSPNPDFPYICPGETCEVNCSDKQCGPDGCGSVCGTCDEGAMCEAGQCIVCSCDGIECGNDNCGNPCGDCDEGGLCVNNQCQSDPCSFTTVVGCCKETQLNYCENGQPGIVDCGDAGCGWDPSANGGAGWYDCGFTEPDPSGEFTHMCYDPAEEVACEAAEECAWIPVDTCFEMACVSGVCQKQAQATGTKCDIDFCVQNQVCTDGVCGGGTPIEPTCGAKECGTDKCGNPCGECDIGFECDEKKGLCEVELPTTYSLDAQPVLQKHCSPCHSEQKLGGQNIATSYADAAKLAAHPSCAGLTVAACSVKRILDLTMPKIAPGSVPPEDLKILQDWIAEGMLL